MFHGRLGYHNKVQHTGSLQQQKCIVLQFQKLEIQDQSASRVDCPWSLSTGWHMVHLLLLPTVLASVYIYPRGLSGYPIHSSYKDTSQIKQEPTHMTLNKLLYCEYLFKWSILQYNTSWGVRSSTYKWDKDTQNKGKLRSQSRVN